MRQDEQIKSSLGIFLVEIPVPGKIYLDPILALYVAASLLAGSAAIWEDLSQKERKEPRPNDRDFTISGRGSYRLYFPCIRNFRECVPLESWENKSAMQLSIVPGSWGRILKTGIVLEQ